MTDVNGAMLACVRRACERKGLGVCITCGCDLPQATGRWPRCASCQLRHNEWTRASSRLWGQRLRARKAALGLCTRGNCPNAITPGRLMCPTHMKNQAEKVRVRRLRQKQEAQRP